MKHKVWRGGADNFPGLSSGRINDETWSVTKNTSPSLASIVSNVPSRPAPVINPNFSSTKEIIPMRGIHRTARAQEGKGGKLVGHENRLQCCETRASFHELIKPLPPLSVRHSDSRNQIIEQQAQLSIGQFMWHSVIPSYEAMHSNPNALLFKCINKM